MNDRALLGATAPASQTRRRGPGSPKALESRLVLDRGGAPGGRLFGADDRGCHLEVWEGGREMKKSALVGRLGRCS